MTKKLLALYGLKWNPFLADVPPEALFVSPGVDSFAFRLENLVREGGFTLDHRRPGHGEIRRLSAARSPPSTTARTRSRRAQQTSESPRRLLS